MGTLQLDTLGTYWERPLSLGMQCGASTLRLERKKERKILRASVSLFLTPLPSHPPPFPCRPTLRHLSALLDLPHTSPFSYMRRHLPALPGLCGARGSEVRGGGSPHFKPTLLSPPASEPPADRSPRAARVWSAWWCTGSSVCGLIGCPPLYLNAVPVSAPCPPLAGCSPRAARVWSAWWCAASRA